MFDRRYTPAVLFEFAPDQYESIHTGELLTELPAQGRYTFIKETEHSDRCLAAWRERCLARKAWIDRFPNYCRHCGANGGHGHSFDPDGSGMGRLEDWDVCTECLEKGLCPRCGGAFEQLSEDDACPHCGWKEDPDADPLPPQYECYCWEESLFGDGLE